MTVQSFWFCFFCFFFRFLLLRVFWQVFAAWGWRRQEEVCGWGEGVVGGWVKSEQHFFFFSLFSPFNIRRSTQISMTTQKTLVHTTSAHIESVFTALAHTENRHTSLQHSNQSQILSYIRLDNRRFLSATSMPSLWCTGCHCHTHWKILSNTHNNANRTIRWGMGRYGSYT